MYPARQIIHKLGASYNVEVGEVGRLVLVLHSVNVQAGMQSCEQRAELTIFFSLQMKFGLEMVTVCNTVESFKNILKKVSN
jgi:hypothetical protein